MLAVTRYKGTWEKLKNIRGNLVLTLIRTQLWNIRNFIGNIMTKVPLAKIYSKCQGGHWFVTLNRNSRSSLSTTTLPFTPNYFCWCPSALPSAEDKTLIKSVGSDCLLDSKYSDRVVVHGNWPAWLAVVPIVQEYRRQDDGRPNWLTAISVSKWKKCTLCFG